MVKNFPVFATLVCDKKELTAVNILINSLRNFGGALNDAPFFVFQSSSMDRISINDPASNTRSIEIKESSDNSGYYFSSKLKAWTIAEEMSAHLTRSLIWIDPACLIIHEPNSLLLNKSDSGAFRPVHIRNIGQCFSEKIDGFWSAIYEQCETPHLAIGITSFVDERTILPYFNSHCFSIDPRLGILSRTEDNVNALAINRDFMESECADEAHKIFLFQAVLSATLLAQVSMKTIRILPPDYGYPFPLQDKIPDYKQINQFNDLTIMVYEDEEYLRKAFCNLSPEPELKNWYFSKIQQKNTNP